MSLIWVLVGSLLKKLEDHCFKSVVWMVAYPTPSDLPHSCSVLYLEHRCHRVIFVYMGHQDVTGTFGVVITKGTDRGGYKYSVGMHGRAPCDKESSDPKN